MIERASEALIKKTALHLLVHRHPGIVRRLRRLKIEPNLLPELTEAELADIGCRPEEISDIRNSYPECGRLELKQAALHGVRVIASDDPGFPELLRRIYDPPGIIYVLGDAGLLVRDSLAVVGSRRASSYGYRVLEDLLPPICHSGLVIVSGMAFGIDARSHLIALREQGKTIGVNAGGLLNLYPAGNQGMIRSIVAKGAVVSEFPLAVVPRPFYFPIRNRVIAGLTRAVLVVEAAMKSGSLITARLALEQNREVLAVPGPISSPLSAGTNRLLQEGAKVILEAGDILEEYGLTLPGVFHGCQDLSPRERRVLDLLAINEVKSIDDFVEELGLSTPETIALLMGLLLKNLVLEEGGSYRRNVNACKRLDRC